MLYVFLPVSLVLCLSLCLSVCLSVCLSMSFSFLFFIVYLVMSCHLPFCLATRLIVCPSACLFICLHFSSVFRFFSVYLWLIVSVCPSFHLLYLYKCLRSVSILPSLPHVSRRGLIVEITERMTLKSGRDGSQLVLSQRIRVETRPSRRMDSPKTFGSEFSCNTNVLTMINYKL